MSVGFEKLIVWQKSIDLAVDIYKITVEFPNHEKYGMKSQINRSCVSVPSNIAEGAGRNSPKEFANFISIARGSGNELESLLILASRIGYIDGNKVKEYRLRINEIQRMLSSLRKQITITPTRKTTKN
jgi:four helix bundle protein